jgi:hypothetical protein
LFEQNGDLEKVKDRHNSNEQIKTEPTRPSTMRNKDLKKEDYDNTGLLLLPGFPVLKKNKSRVKN